ncbi:MAG: thioredoxin family protein [Saprospiraceae bacterium]|nr:thioredoxin family protein [Saprospiraceae bacterium]
MLNLAYKIALTGFASVLFFIGMGNILYAQSNNIEWLSWEQMESMMKKQKRKVIVDIYTDRCSWCKRMDQTTFQDPAVIKALSKDYYAVKLNADYREDIVFKDRVFKYVTYGKRGCHQLALEITQNNLSFPTFVFMDENLDVIQPIPGYLDSKTFEIIASYFYGNHHKSTPFQVYEESYKASNNTPAKSNPALKTVNHRKE